MYLSLAGPGFARLDDGGSSDDNDDADRVTINQSTDRETPV